MKNLFTSHRRITALFAALFTLALHNMSNAQTYSHIHVDAANGINALAGRGTAAAPYKSITYAFLISGKNNLPDPWHVHIHPGTYDADPAKPATEREIFPIRLRSGMIFEGTTNADECILDAQHLGETTVPLLLGENAEGVHIRNVTIKNLLVQLHEFHGAQIILRTSSTSAVEKPNTLKGCILHYDPGLASIINGHPTGVLGLWTNMPLVLVENTVSNSMPDSVRIENFDTSAARIVVTNNTFRLKGTALILGGAFTGDIIGNFCSGLAVGSIKYGPEFRRYGSLKGNIRDNTFSNGVGIRIGGTNRHTPVGEVKMEGDITNNIFQGNSLRSLETLGGALFVDKLSGNITHNTFTNNTAGSHSYVLTGGAFAVRILNGNITHNTFTSNTATGRGGAFSVGTLDGNITHNTFTNNNTPYVGCILIGTMTGDIAYNEFTRNTGGAVVFDNKLTGNITHNIFDSNNNSEGSSFGGLRVGRGPSRLHTNPVKISNNIFFNNKTTNPPPGGRWLTQWKPEGHMLIAWQPVHMMNNLFMTTSDEPIQGKYKPHIWLYSPQSRVHNNIFAGMQVAIHIDGDYDLPITHNIFHNIGQNIVSKGGAGLGNDIAFWELFAENASNNLAVAPLFVLGEKDFHLQAASPAIDAGTNAYAPEDDLEGNARPAGAAVDIGPYEYGGTPVVTIQDPIAPDDPPTVAEPEAPAQPYPAWDVNEDGKTDITDLTLVAAALGTRDPENPRLDVNGDGIVAIQDLILVATHLGETTAAAAPGLGVLPKSFTSETLQQVLHLLWARHDGSLVHARALANVERLLASLMPKETALLANYPNPFNPETWIPYQLAKPADVTVHIWTTDRKLVRTLALGHQAIGTYYHRSRAAYWDGKNGAGEPVASGVYFYTLTAGDFTATRKMLIRK